jgi:hypothetical protein
VGNIYGEEMIGRRCMREAPNGGDARDAERGKHRRLGSNMSAKGDLIAQVRRVLSEAGEGADLQETLQQVLAVISERCGCESVGIRWRASDDYPYLLTRGFGREFEIVEGPLCARDSVGLILRHPDGTPQLACLCGAVVLGRTDPSLPVFTEEGSFWTNGGRALADEARDGRFAGISLRGYCMSQGYESIAIIPLRIEGETRGVLQLNSRTRGRFSEALISEYEEVARDIAAAVPARTEQSAQPG